VSRFLAIAVLGVLLAIAPAARAQPFEDPALEQIRLLHGLSPYSLEVWTKYLALQEQLIQKAMRDQPAIVEQAEKKFENLPASLQELRRRLPATGEKGLSDDLFTGSLLPDQQGASLGTLSGGEVAQLEASVEDWISAALSASELELRFSRSELDEAASILPPLTALAKERERKQEIIAKIVVIIADVLEELTRRQEEQQRLDRSKGKADKLEPSARHGPWRDLARSSD
jgi:hypothetical protein